MQARMTVKNAGNKIAKFKTRKCQKMFKVVKYVLTIFILSTNTVE